MKKVKKGIITFLLTLAVAACNIHPFISNSAAIAYASEVESTLDKLNALLVEARALKESDYTPESWTAFAEVRDSIESPEEIPEKYQQAILDGLQEAINQLVEKTDVPDSVLEDGTYAVRFTTYTDREKKLIDNNFTEAGRQTLVKVKNGKYEVTFRKADSSRDVMYQVLKQEYFDDTKTLFGQKAGAKNWIDGFDFKNEKFNSAIQAGFISENDKYWIDTKYEIHNNYTDFTIELEDLSEDIYLWTSQKAKNTSQNNTTKVGYIDFDEDTAQKIFVDEYRSVKSVNYQIFAGGGDYSGKELVPTDVFDNKSTQWSASNNIASAKTGINEKYQEVFSSAHMKEWCSTGEDIPAVDNSIDLSFDLSDEKDIALGKKIYFEEQEEYWATYISIYPQIQEVESFEMEDNIAHAKITTDTTVLSKSTRLTANEIIDNPKTTDDGYSIFHDNLDSISKNLYMYYWNYESSPGVKSINTSQKVTMKFKIPDGWNSDNVRLAYWGGEGTGGIDPNATGTVDIVGIENGYYVVTTKRIGYFCLYELKDTTAAGDNLADGTYNVPVSVYHLTIAGQASMADKCLNDVGKVVVKDGVKTLYMDYTTVDNTAMGLTGYMTKMWLYGADTSMVGNTPTGTLNPVIFTSYYKNDDGSFIVDDFNQNSLNYYPKEGYVQLVSDDAKWPAKFKVPVMDVIGGGNFEQDAWLTLDWANAEKISDETLDAPIKDALEQAIVIAESTIKEEYTTDTWNTLETAYNAAAKVYENESSNTDEITKAYTELRSAIDGMEKPNVVDIEDGLYTAGGTTGDANIVTGTRMLLSSKTVEDIKTITAYMSLNVTGIKGLAYYDPEQKDYIDAALETDLDGVVTKASLTINNLRDMLTILYLNDKNETVSASLKLSDFVKQEVDKSQLAEAIVNANTRLEEAAKDSDKYDTGKITALQSAVSAATEVNKDPVAIQSEADAQTEAVNTAISALTETISKEVLQNAVTEAKKLSGDTYTPNSFQILTDAIASANDLIAKEDATAQALEAELMKLKAAQEGLITRTDKSVLQKAYDEAAAITNQGYAGWKTLQTVLENAKKVIEDANVTAIQVNDQISAINNAVNNLDGGIDKSVLISMIDEANKLDVSGYSDMSVAYFKSAIESAKATVNNEEATQQGIDKQIQLLQAASESLIQKAQDDAVYEGIYTIDGRMWHSSADQPSMGNAALIKPMQLVVAADKDGNTSVTLRMEYKALTTSLGQSNFNGYLAALNYFPGWEGKESGYEIPAGETPVPADVESYYEGVYDSFNDPATGTDENVKNKLYPHFMTIPADLNDSEIWVQVYVPVMESLTIGSGTQFAKLQLDWGTLKQTTGVQTDKDGLNVLTEKAQSLFDGLKDGDVGKTPENVEMLRNAIGAAKDVSGNLNVDQTAVDATVRGLQAAMNVFSEEVVQVDKSELKKAIDAADTYLNDKDVIFTETTREILQTARDKAQKVYEDDKATLTQVNSAVREIDDAVKSLQIDSTDKRELKKALESTKTYLEDTKNYLAAAIEVLQSLYDKAKTVYEDEKATQDFINAQVRILNYAAGDMKKVEDVTVDKSGLHSMLLIAANMAGRENLYTAATIKNLRNTITEAEKVYENKKATQAVVNEKAYKLSSAMLALEAKPVNNSGSNNSDSSNNGSNNGSNNNDNNNNDSNNNNSSNNDGGNNILDIKNLADGIYSLTGSMVKIDKSTASMSNEAINQTIKLTVTKGKYYITMDFKGLKISGQLGYLSSLKYFKSGYKLDKYNAPQGTLQNVTIDSYQKYSDGTLVSDNLGTNYPNQITFEMIPEALNDGYVPLQVFVPIMDAISSGSGTQPVFLKLTWSTLKKVSEDESFEDDGVNEKTDNSNNNNTTNNNLTSTLPNGNSSGLNSGTTNSLGSPKASLSSGSSALKSGVTNSLESGSTKKLSTSTGLSGNGGTKLNGTTSKISGAAANTKANGEAVNAKASGASKSTSSKAVVPTIMSLLALLAGVSYKLISRKWIFG